MGVTMKSLMQLAYYRGVHTQALRNVAILTPSIIQITTGSKRLYWQESTLDIDAHSLLLCRANHALHFENLPQAGQFSSRQFCFSLSPTSEMMSLSERNGTTTPHLTLHHPVVRCDKALNHTLNLLAELPLGDLSAETLTFWLYGLYQQLAERGVLHLMFAPQGQSFEQKLSEFIAQQPSKDHQIEDACQHFAISKATLIRRLKEEGTQYREVLSKVRLSHALSLMQQGHRKTAELSLMCGYQSPDKFSQRFRQRFGLSPREYCKTLPN
ncbi:helix-turn-helix transcriptional regulator [Vibrio vulnificus]|nr:helix-turn-helix transcriptional regulator [Vibrio vulnificus]ELH9431302.1 helix-turn-helix transcriptional regulator [Vibrio vulnificus]